MVGMGSVVTKSVPDFHLVLGSPARSIGCVCRQLIVRFPNDIPANFPKLRCPDCELEYSSENGEVTELNPPVPQLDSEVVFSH
jgi:UDP-2-acetamido-3-amino-2,3-dideoxy-glucuronate N-acetyltransferase